MVQTRICDRAEVLERVVGAGVVGADFPVVIQSDVHHSPPRELSRPSTSPIDLWIRPLGRQSHLTTSAFAPVLVAVILGVVGYLPDLLAPTTRTWLAISLSVTMMVAVIAVRRPPIRWTLSATALAVFYLTGTFTLVRYGTFSDLIGSVATLGLAVLLALLVSSFDEAETNKLVNGILVVCAIQLLFALAETFLHVKAPRGYSGVVGSTFGVNPLLPGFGRAPGTLGHAIPLGTYMACGVLLLVFAKRSWPTYLRVLGGGAFTFGIFLSGTRSALFFGIAAAFLCLCFRSNSRRHLAWRVITVVSVAVFLLSSGLSLLTEAVGLNGTGSLTHRIAAIDAIGRLVERSSPEVIFGSGAGSIKPLFELGFLQSDGFEAVDNELVSVFALAGLVGVVSIISLIIVGLRRARPGVQPTVLFLTLMFFSFDIFARLSTLLLFVSIAAGGTAHRRRRS